MREEKITIFNKNGITLEKILTRYINPLKCDSNLIEISGKPQQDYFTRRTKKAPEFTEVRCVSKLGFYYTKSVRTENIQEEENLSKKIRKVIISGLDGKWVYHLTYLVSYHGTEIGYETRPWDLIGGSFPDNYMWGLFEDINKLFDEFKYKRGT